jgi:hypothetical protein
LVIPRGFHPFPSFNAVFTGFPLVQGDFFFLTVRHAIYDSFQTVKCIVISFNS